MTTSVKTRNRNGKSQVQTLTSPDGTAATLGKEIFSGGGELGDRIRAFDWSSTPMGPISSWPQSLKTAVRILITSRYAMWMGWGPELTFLYNDAYARMTLGKKHPWALGRSFREVWGEVWTDLGPRIRTVLETGEATWDKGLLLFLERSGYAEETYHTFSYSPLTGDDGRISGIFCVVMEETERIIGERQLGCLRSLAAGLSAAITEDKYWLPFSRIWARMNAICRLHSPTFLRRAILARGWPAQRALTRATRPLLP